MENISSAAQNDTTWIKREPVQNADYSIAVLGDIQCVVYHDNVHHTNHLERMIDWLLDNKEKRKIGYIFELGDTVETLTTYEDKHLNPQEWVLAAPQIHRLNGQVEYSVIRGNHDDEAGYHKYICTDAYKSQMDEFFFDPTLPVTMGNSMSNSYRKIDIEGRKYLMLSLDYNVRPETAEWVERVIASNPDRKIIVSIHAYLGANGDFYNQHIGSSNVDDTKLECFPFNYKALLWDNLLSKYENVVMVLSGHQGVDDPVITVRRGINGNEVVDILVDPQDYERNNPCGFVMMLNFFDDDKRIEIEYFSVSKGLYFKDKNQRTVLLCQNG